MNFCFLTSGATPFLKLLYKVSCLFFYYVSVANLNAYMVSKNNYLDIFLKS